MDINFMDQQRLRELENQCIQEYAPWCAAACPVHVDVRSMLAAITQGDFPGALKIYRKAVPFARIISRICDQPCQKDCKRGEAGGAIEIAALEHACVEYSQSDVERAIPLPGKRGRTAVVGGGLSGLAVAFDLARKGYHVAIYEANQHLGGSLWEYPQEVLPWPVILSDISLVEDLGVEIHLNTPVSKVGSNGRLPPLALLCEQYDAVYLGVGFESGTKVHEICDLNLNEHGRVQVDPATFMTSQDGIFAGGSMLSSATLPAQDTYGELPQHSPIQEFSDGRRAATSIDRYLQKVSLTASRVNEGAYTTRLYTVLKDVQPVPPVSKSPGSNYTPQQAIEEARRCLQCECMECVKVCEYLAHYGRYPRKYVREIYNNLSIIMGNRQANRFTNSCSLCGLCAEVCPEDLNMGEVCRNARQVMVQQNRMPPSAHDFALRDMAFSNGDAFSLARNPPGRSSSQYIFFPGCQLSASGPEYVEKVYAYLQERLPGDSSKDAGIGLMLRCCGAPADWAGRSDLFQASQEEFLADYESLGKPKVILACSSCYWVFKTHFPSVAITSLWEIFDNQGLPDHFPRASRPRLSSPLAIHDPCSTRYESQIQDSVRRILQRLGYEVEELPLSRERTECCSYGGLMWLAHPELAARVIQRRIQGSPADYVTYCAMCRDFFARQGKPTLHLLDLIFVEDPFRLADRRGPGYSQRHENRRRLKKKLLKEIWGEDMADKKAYEGIQLIIPREAQEMLEARQILVEDIQQVIEYAERTGSKLLNKRTRHFLAYYKPGTVTYWVEYSPAEEAYLIHKAYSHRMEIGEEAKK
jgi:NADPH-dependent glutamate synthase beta subunit-like oxidoreductase